MNAALIAILAGAAGTATLVCHLALRRREGEGQPDAPSSLPPAVRALVRLSAPWHPAIEARVGSRIDRSLAALLARAGLHHDLRPAAWIGGLAASILAGTVPGVLAATAGALSVGAILGGAVLAPLMLQAWLRRRANERSGVLLKELPTLLELLVLCLEAGASLGVALRIAADKSAPGPLRDLLTDILQRIRAGQSRATSLKGTLGALDLEATTALATALVQAESSGMSLGPVLRAQAEQVMSERFVRAERAAMQAPVKLLLPLLACIFPCTFIVIAVPILSRLMGIATA